MSFQGLSQSQAADYHRDGYVIVRSLFSAEEMNLLIRKAKADRALMKGAADRRDSTGRISKIALWNHPGDDLYGMISRSRRIVDAVGTLLGGEVYHWHSKMMLKEPEVGGAWEWHQDYGYWYQYGCLRPDLMSCSIAVDRANRENGCLQVLKGSHRWGRFDALTVGDQRGVADPERIEEAKKRLDLAYVELDPGDAVFFHSILLHASAPNTSPHPRWSLICCYNRADNSPYTKESRHPHYTPLEKVDDSAVLEVGRREVAGITR